MSIEIRAAGVLLDMDGTLVDSSAAVDRAWTDWAESHGLDLAEVMAVIPGRQSRESMALLLPQRSLEETLADDQLMIERETTDLDGVVPIAGAIELLEALADRPHALVTSAVTRLATARMGAAGLRMPAVAVTGEAVSASKPDPEGFLAAAAALGVPADQCVVFEDSGAGIAAGRAAGMRVVGVGAAAVDHGADWVVPDLTRVRVAANGLTLHL